MSANKYKNHLVVFLEDDPYRELVNGVKLLAHFNDSAITTKNPSKGWPKVFADLEDNLCLLNVKEKMYALLLMDFDNQYETRRGIFHKITQGQACAERVFLLGIDRKESENLKSTLKLSNHEAVGRKLLETCPDEISELWGNHHLECNLAEIDRMKKSGVFDWLFKG